MGQQREGRLNLQKTLDCSVNHFTCKVRGWTRLFLSCLYLYYLYSVKHTSNGSEEGKSRVLVGKQWRAQIQGESVEPYHKSTDPKPPILALYTEQLQRNFPRLGTVSATPTVSYYKEAPYGPRDGAGLKAPSSGDRQCTGKPRAGALQASGPLTPDSPHTEGKQAAGWAEKVTREGWEMPRSGTRGES